MGGAYETSPRTRDDCERHQFKNSNKCSLYGDTMPLTHAAAVHVVHTYHYGPYGTYKIRNSDKTYVFPVVELYTVLLRPAH